MQLNVGLHADRHDQILILTFKLNGNITMTSPNNPLLSKTSILEIPIVQFVIFITISTVYFLGVCHFFDVNLIKLKKLDPNSLGDFLAGTFAPLGFILLILGYMLNTRALKIQAEELRNSVEEQRELVKTAKDELDLIQNKDKRQTQLNTIQVQPFFHILDLSFFVHELDEETQIQAHFNFKNSRALCRNLFFIYSFDDNDKHFTCQNNFDIINGDPTVIHSTSLYFIFDKKLINNLPKIIHLNLNYIDLYENLQIQTLTIHFGDNFHEDTEHYYQHWSFKSYVD